MEKIYFGHPVNFYDTPKECDLIDAILKVWPNSFIENPNQVRHQVGYKEYKERTGNGMAYFSQEVLPKMDRGVFLPFEDGMFGAGVFKEAMKLAELGKPIHQIKLDGKISKMYISELHRMLSVEETRKRVYGR